MPDIDVDFCRKRRDEVIRYVTEKYGKDNVAQITTFGTMKSKAAVRDIGRALGMPYAEVDKIAKLITSDEGGSNGPSAKSRRSATFMQQMTACANSWTTRRSLRD